MVRLYHFTDSDGQDGIIQMGSIMQTSGQSRDMYYGEGVYLTAMDPDKYSKKQLAQNNYTAGGGARLDAGRLDHYICIDIPESNSRLAKCQTSDGRDIWLYRGNIKLDNFEWSYDSNANWSAMQVGGLVAGVTLGAAALIGGLAYLAKSMSDDGQDKKNRNQRDRR